MSTASLGSVARPIAEDWNRECFCMTLDRDALCEALRREAGDPDFCTRLITTRPHLFADTPLF